MLEAVPIVADASALLVERATARCYTQIVVGVLHGAARAQMVAAGVLMLAGPPRRGRSCPSGGDVVEVVYGEVGNTKSYLPSDLGKRHLRDVEGASMGCGTAIADTSWSGCSRARFTGLSGE